MLTLNTLQISSWAWCPCREHLQGTQCDALLVRFATQVGHVMCEALVASPIASQQEALSTYLREVACVITASNLQSTEKHTDISKEGPTLASHRYHKWWSGRDCCQGRVGPFHCCFTNQQSQSKDDEFARCHCVMLVPWRNALQRNIALGHIRTHSALLHFETVAQNS